MYMFVLVMALQTHSQVPVQKVVEEARMPTADGEAPWGRLGAVTALSGGAIVAIDFATGVPYRFDRAGRPRGPLGRNGSGPGEFRGAVWSGVRGDSLWIWDLRLQRLTWYDDQLGILGTQAPAMRSSALVAQAGGGFLVIPARRRSDDSSRVLRFRSGGEFWDTVTTVDVSRGRLAITLDDGTTLTGSQPFADDPLLTLSRDGRGWLRVDRSTDGPPRITVLSGNAEGADCWRLNLDYDPIPISAAIVDSVLLLMHRDVGQQGPRLRAESIRRSLSIPARMPPVRSLQSDQDGRIWIQWAAPGEGYLVISGNGEKLFEVKLPPSARLLGGSQDRVWAAVLDEEGGEVLVEFSLHSI
jgi:hypothetical protein